MGLMDKITGGGGDKGKDQGGYKDQAADAVDQHGDRIDQGIDRGGDFADKKTGGQHSDKIDQGGDRARDGLDSLDGTKGDDFDTGNTSR